MFLYPNIWSWTWKKNKASMYFVLIVALDCLLNSRTKRFMNFFFLCPRNFESEDRRTVRSNAPYSSKFNGKKNRILITYSTYSSRWFSSGVHHPWFLQLIVIKPIMRKCLLRLKLSVPKWNSIE